MKSDKREPLDFSPAQEPQAAVAHTDPDALFDEDFDLPVVELVDPEPVHPAPARP